MIAKVKSRKLNMPMLEIIITLGILMIVSVFLMRLFLGANSLENKARDISKACILAENAGEVIKATEDLETAIIELNLTKTDSEGEGLTFEKHFDSKWQEVDTTGAYTMKVVLTETDYATKSLVTADITIVKNKSYAVIKRDIAPLSQLTCKSYKDKSE